MIAVNLQQFLRCLGISPLVSSGEGEKMEQVIVLEFMSERKKEKCQLIHAFIKWTEQG